jgi:uncharacterized protein (TIGR00297 family)
MSFELIIVTTGIIGLAVAIAGWRFGALSNSGLGAALFVGLVILLLGGAHWAILLLLFFISGSVLSAVRHRQRPTTELGKGKQRDAFQVLANVGMGVILAPVSFLTTGGGWYEAFAASIAAVTADTWATELGVLWGGTPRMITNGRFVPPGASGGVSIPGLLASVGGASLIGLSAGLMSGGGMTFRSVVWWAIICAGAGTIGSLVDSWLGATVQAAFLCPKCLKPTELKVHSCGVASTSVKGWPWLTNDAVNLAAALAGCLVGWVLWHLAR